MEERHYENGELRLQIDYSPLEPYTKVESRFKNNFLVLRSYFQEETEVKVEYYKEVNSSVPLKGHPLERNTVDLFGSPKIFSKPSKGKSFDSNSSFCCMYCRRCYDINYCSGCYEWISTLYY